MSFHFTIGKSDAGSSILIGEGSHIVEFPSVLLPPGCEPGSIVSISCQRDVAAEQRVAAAFWSLQDTILDTFGAHSPAAPVLKLRNVTQTSVTLEWEPLQLASAKVLSLSIWRNGQRLAAIPNPTTNTSTKLSGLDLDSAYTFHLVLKTSAGSYTSNLVKTRTHTIANTSGIRVCFGTVAPPEVLESAKAALDAMKAGYSTSIQIDTTHFVCTSPGSSPDAPQASQLYQKALQMSIPTVVPSWIEACRAEKKLVPIAKHYLGTAATPNVSAATAARPAAPAAAPAAPLQARSPPPAAPTETATLESSPPPVASTSAAAEPQATTEPNSSPKRVTPELESAAEAAPPQVESGTGGVEAEDEPAEVVDMLATEPVRASAGSSEPVSEAPGPTEPTREAPEVKDPAPEPVHTPPEAEADEPELETPSKDRDDPLDAKADDEVWRAEDSPDTAGLGRRAGSEAGDLEEVSLG